MKNMENMKKFKVGGIYSITYRDPKKIPVTIYYETLVQCVKTHKDIIEFKVLADLYTNKNGNWEKIPGQIVSYDRQSLETDLLLSTISTEYTEPHYDNNYLIKEIADQNEIEKYVEYLI